MPSLLWENVSIEFVKIKENSYTETDLEKRTPC